MGALGTLLDFGVLTGLKLLGWPTLAAKSLSFSAGLLNNYTLGVILRCITAGEASRDAAKNS